MEYLYRKIIASFFVILTPFFITACFGSSGNGNGGEEVDDTAEGETNGDVGGPDGEPGLSVLAAELQSAQGLEVEGGDEAVLGSFHTLDMVDINDQGDVTAPWGLRDPQTLGSVGHVVQFKVPSGGADPQPVAWPGMSLDEYPNAEITETRGRIVFGEKESIYTFLLMEENSGERYIAIRYQNGRREVILDGDDIPGLTDHRIRGLQFYGGFWANEKGELTARIQTEVDGDNSHVWLRGDADEIEPLMVWGDGTGEINSDTGKEYVFQWPFIGGATEKPLIAGDGSIYTLADSKVTREDSDDDRHSLRGIWKASPEDDRFKPLVERNRTVIEASGDTRDQDLSAVEEPFTVNDEGDVGFRNEYMEGGGTARDLWVKRDGEFHAIAREDDSAPNMDAIDTSHSGIFNDVGIGVLSNTGTIAFYAEVSGKSSIWLDDGATFPIAVEGMEVPGISEMEFDRIGLVSGFPNVAPLINNHDQIVFWAEHRDADDGNHIGPGIWAYDECNGLTLVAAVGGEIEVEGVPELVGWDDDNPVWGPGEMRTREVQEIEDPPGFQERRGFGPNAGRQNLLNDAGELVFVAQLDGDIDPAEFQSSEGTGTLPGQYVLLHYQLPSC